MSLKLDGAEENTGSSPRVWGTCIECLAEADPQRFIPTCVGNMRVITYHSDASTVHPHVCGEHFIYPHAARTAMRFIPTCVGNMHHEHQ